MPAEIHQIKPDEERLAVPQEREARDRIVEAVRKRVEEKKLVPPLSMEELRGQAKEIALALGIDERYENYTLVLVGNEVWRETVAAVPYERRILLLPQCLRVKAECLAEQDEIGLFCEQCGKCSIGNLQSEAEELGYIVLVAEGTTVVTKLLEQGKVDAVVGVSCLATLERSFPYMAADAIPGIAIPLIDAGCDNTTVDLDLVRDAIRLKSRDGWAGRLDLDRLREEVKSWFRSDDLPEMLGGCETQTEKIGLSWLAKEGKRWRPFLAVCVYKALNGVDSEISETMKRVAIAVECFHKASLVHDDIEDDDDLRYGDMTLHRQNGIPVALNVGDLLLGEGYGLIVRSEGPAEQLTRMIEVAASGHRTLCLGQGEELCWMREPAPLSSQKVLEIFRRKTAPAFEVALQLGAIGAGADGKVSEVLKTFSESLGIAYQIRDDLDDFFGEGADGDAHAMRPSILFALAFELANGSEKEQIFSAWRHGTQNKQCADNIQSLISGLRAEEKSRQLLEHYKNEAIRSLSPLQNAHLKTLLRRIVGKILGRETGHVA